MHIRLRPADDGDIPALLALHRLSSLATGEHVEALLANPDVFGVPAEHVQHTTVAEIGGRVLGYCTILPDTEGNMAELDGLFVDPVHWRQGLGSTLLRASEQKAFEAGVERLWVTSGQRAEAFYTAVGFVRAGEQETRFGPAVRFVKEVVNLDDYRAVGPELTPSL